MSKQFTVLLVAVLFLAILALPNDASAVLYRTLSEGDSGYDVLELQQLLNSDPATQVAASGPGSLGRETIIFGPLTRQAVIRFQQKYAADILKPQGLAVGSGLVDQKTLEKLNTLVPFRTSAAVLPASDQNVVVPAAPPPIPEDELGKSETETSLSRRTEIKNPASAQALAGLPEVKMSRLMSITSISPTFGRPSTKITITGKGFSKVSNDVFVGSRWIKGVKSRDGQTLTVVVPDPFGSYEYRSRFPMNGKFTVPVGIYVKNSTGASNGQIFTMKY